MAKALRSDSLDDVCELITQVTGVQLGEKNRVMVESRLTKRLISLGLKSVAEYVAYFNEHQDEELKSLISLMTTHHTYFFREFSQFDFLLQTALPSVVARLKASGQKKIRVWSAACSRGQEVYSLAMFLDQHLSTIAPGFSFEIHGSDIDPESVHYAQNGVYPWREVKEIPRQYLEPYWSRGVGDIREFAAVKKSLREHCSFGTGNLISPGQTSAAAKYDIIFCRNVFIYFSPDQIAKSTHTLLSSLESHGYLFVGLSESLNQLQLPTYHVGPSVYMKERPSASAGTSASASKGLGATPRIASNPVPNPLRVLCVDDSGTVLSLLKKVLARTHGFEVVGVAKNGLEATQWLKSNTADLLTLDIHMPEQGGVEYLERNFKAGSHPPVVVVSSVSREDKTLAQKCLSLGASDYVEKPDLANLDVKGEELRNKLLSAWKLRATGTAISIPAKNIDKQFSRDLAKLDPKHSALIVVATASRRTDVETIWGTFASQNRPPMVWLEPQARGSVGGLFKALQADHFSWDQTYQHGPLHGSLEEHFLVAAGSLGTRHCSVLFLDDGTNSLVKACLKNASNMKRVQVLADDSWQAELGTQESPVHKLMRLPVTSMAYHVEEFLGGWKKS
ncbi:MAG: response regulator [Bdellovibrionales bacterium]|nr:response regulator [Bdellovibrionales bacterium]